MPHPHPFVGRKTELEQFESVLADPTPQAILIVGQQGMGKSMLARKFHDMAQPHAITGGGSFVFQVRKNQSIDRTLEDVLVEAEQAAHAAFGTLRFTGARQRIWSGLISLIAGGGAGEIAQTLVGGNRGDTAQKFIRFLTEWSAKLPDSSRVVFVFDSDKYMADDCAASWTSLVNNLPRKIKFVFAQRPDDVLARSADFNRLETNGKLLKVEIGVLDNERDPCVAGLVEHRRPPVRENIVRAVFDRYDGHPFAVQAGLDLVADGTAVEDLPTDPTHPTQGIAAEQWRHVGSRGDEAMRLLKAYAVLEVPVPDDVAREVSGVDRERFERLSRHDHFVSGLLAGADGHRQIYHSLLSEYLVKHVLGDEVETYHRKAIDLFRQKLKHAHETQSAPDALAAERLPEHVLAADGVGAFVDCFVGECTPPLSNLSRLDAAIDLSNRALDLVRDDPGRVATLSGNLGVIHRMRGDFDKAEEMHHKALEIYEKLGRLDGIASQHCNLGTIHLTRGDVDQADEKFRRALEIYEKLGRLDGIASQHGNLGAVHQARGELDQAEKMHRKSLKIEEKLGQLEGMAKQYGNLGVIYQTRGDLDKAEEMHRKSIEINKKLGRLEGVANQYGNLGLIHQTRGDLDKAEEMHSKSLDIAKKLDLPEGMATAYGNLGLIYVTRGDLDQAEEMHRKSIEINEKLGRLGGMARDYAAIGLVHTARGELEQAETMHRKGLEIEKRLGRLDGLARQYVNLGIVYQRRTDLDKAEGVFRKSLEIYEKLGRLEGMGNAYGNLGSVYLTRGDFDQAEKMTRKALEINEKLARLEGAASAYANLGLVAEERGDLVGAGDLWTEARNLYQKIGIPHMVKQVQAWLDSLPPDDPQ